MTQGIERLRRDSFADTRANAMKPVLLQKSEHPLLQIRALTMRFGGLTAVDAVSFDVRRGDVTALIGPNGAGKTTCFNCITGFYRPTTGLIAFTRGDGAGFRLDHMPDHAINRAGVARTFQNIRLFSGMTCLENLMVAQHRALTASGSMIAGLLGLPMWRVAEKRAIERATGWLEHLRLIDRADDAAGELSYGEQRRLEIARALCTEPELLCLDEPAAGLNPRESGELTELIAGLRQVGISILLIEHDMGVVMRVSDRVIVLDYGRKIADGTPAEVRADPKVIAAYLGVDDDEVASVIPEGGR